MKKIFITGITGQDGIFLTKNLINGNKDIQIIGSTRNNSAEKLFFSRLKYLEVPENNFDKVKLQKLNLKNSSDVDEFLRKFKPNFIYNLTGPSSVYESIKFPNQKYEIENIFINLIKSLLNQNNLSGFYQASSSEMFDSSTDPLDEYSLFKANTPYASGKLSNHQKIIELKNEFNLNLYSGITFNHDSEFRDNKYLIMKIISNAIKIKNKEINEFEIGSIEYIRDWSYADDVVKAMVQICELGSDTSYVIGRGKGNKIKDILDIVFEYLELDWKPYVKINNNLLRKNSPISIISNPKKIQEEFNWTAQVSFRDMVLKLLKFKLAS